MNAEEFKDKKEFAEVVAISKTILDAVMPGSAQCCIYASMLTDFLLKGKGFRSAVVAGSCTVRVNDATEGNNSLTWTFDDYEGESLTRAQPDGSHRVAECHAWVACYPRRDNSDHRVTIVDLSMIKNRLMRAAELSGVPYTLPMDSLPRAVMPIEDTLSDRCFYTPSDRATRQFERSIHDIASTFFSHLLEDAAQYPEKYRAFKFTQVRRNDGMMGLIIDANKLVEHINADPVFRAMMEQLQKEEP